MALKSCLKIKPTTGPQNYTGLILDFPIEGEMNITTRPTYFLFGYATVRFKLFLFYLVRDYLNISCNL